jgi:N-glycosylase/DNA lyase
MTTQHEGWVSLGTPADELLLANTLVTGQSFRWRRTDDTSRPYDTYTGVIGQRLVQMRQLPSDVQYRVLARRCVSSPLLMPDLLRPCIQFPS